jgi:hypothetical protein
MTSIVLFALPGDRRVFWAKHLKNNNLQILFPAKSTYNSRNIMLYANL